MDIKNDIDRNEKEGKRNRERKRQRKNERSAHMTKMTSIGKNSTLVSV